MVDFGSNLTVFSSILRALDKIQPLQLSRASLFFSLFFFNTVKIAIAFGDLPTRVVGGPLLYTPSQLTGTITDETLDHGECRRQWLAQRRKHVELRQCNQRSED